jgi:hypothetical protein
LGDTDFSRHLRKTIGAKSKEVLLGTRNPQLADSSQTLGRPSRFGVGVSLGVAGLSIGLKGSSEVEKREACLSRSVRALKCKFMGY